MPASRPARAEPPPRAGIVHLGPGAFFRAFLADFTQDAMRAAGGDWGITAISLRSPTARDQLGPQGGVFTAVAMHPDGPRPRQIGSVVDVLVAPEDPAAAIAAMADPAIRILSLTVTEKGYCRDAATGRLAEDHPDIRHDLANRRAPRSAPGLLVAALRARRAKGAGPVTVLSCDNLPANGRATRAVVLDLTRRLEPDLAEWIAAHVTFPSTMVDRITPATTPQDIADVQELTGLHDPACVLHEPFRQWVIEDDFAAGRPAWDRAGAEMVADVAAHEAMKLRCLNGTHSALAYLGYLAGHRTIADCVADPVFARYCTALWQQEILPTLTRPEGTDMAAYCDSLMARYRNPAIRHRTWQIAMDGSQKLPQRLLGTIADNLAARRLPLGLITAVAGWMRYVGGRDEAGAEIDLRDPLAGELRAATSATSDPSGQVEALLSMRAIFDPALAADRRFRGALLASYSALSLKGARATLAGLVEDG